jgi:hypothetical protein
MMIRTICMVAACTVLVTGCSTAKKQMGLGRHSPDEFAVVERAPLTLPPDYALRPPRAGGETLQNAQTQAKRVVLGSAASESNAAVQPNSGTEALLQQAGATQPKPDIRATLDKESTVISTQNRTVAEKLLFWDKDAGPAVTPAEKMDATTEAQRLNQQGITAPTPGQMRQPAATPATPTP